MRYFWFGLLCWFFGELAVCGESLPEVTTFVIPRSKRAPVIDGVIGEEEWWNSLCLSGASTVGSLRNPIHPRATQFFLAWDDENLYISARTEVLKNEQLLMNVRDRDTEAVVFDDSLEFGFDPKGRNVKPGGVPACYKVLVNFLGRFGFRKILPSIGGFDPVWKAKFVTKSSFSTDRKWWEFEMAVPVKELEQTRLNRAGDVFGLLLGRNLKTGGWNQVAIPTMTTGYFDPSGWLVGKLVENTPFVRILGVESLATGKVKLRIIVRNPSPSESQVTLTAVLKSMTEGSEPSVWEKTVKVRAGSEESVKFANPLPGEKGKLELLAHLRDRTVLLAYRASYEVGYGKGQMPEDLKPLQTETFPFRARFNPIRSLLWLEGDTLNVPHLSQAKAMKWSVADPEGKLLASGVIDQPYCARFQKLVQLDRLDVGEYIVSATMLDADGRELASANSSFKRLNEKEEFPWFGNEIGNPERVLPPFEPLKAKGRTLKMWGREYMLNALCLPERIISQGYDVLAEPVRVVVVLDGNEHIIRAEGKAKFTERRPWRIRMKGRAEGAGLRFTSRSYLEQDGALFVSLCFRPLGEEVCVDSLRIEYPLREEVAELMASTGAGGNFAANKTGFVPRGEGTVWSTLELGRQASGMTVGTFFPQVWLGNERCGLVWWADNDKGWVPDNDIPAHEVLRKNRKVILRNNIIGEPFTVHSPHTLNFVLNATPHKPLPPGWRLLIYSFDGSFCNPGAGERGFKTDKITGIEGWNLLHPPSHDPAQWGKIFENYRKNAQKRMKQLYYWNGRRWGDFLSSSIPIMGYGRRSLDDKVYAYFSPDWDDSFNKSMNDYYLWLMRRWVREGGLIQWYLDITFPRFSSSLLNGLAYQLPDGRIQPGYNLSNFRQFYKRLFAMMTDEGLMPGGIVSHSTNDYPFAVMPWLDAVLDGESHSITDTSTFDWVDGYPEERLRSLPDTHAWGTVINWMDLIRVSDKKRAEKLRRGKRGWLMIHDTWAGASAFPIHGVWNWGLARADVTFIPYWRNSEYIKNPNPELKISLWTLPDRAMLVLFNLNKEKPATVDITLDLKKLGLMPMNPLRNKIGIYAIEGPSLSLWSNFDIFTGELKRFEVEPRDYAIVAIQRY